MLLNLSNRPVCRLCLADLLPSDGDGADTCAGPCRTRGTDTGMLHGPRERHDFPRTVCVGFLPEDAPYSADWSPVQTGIAHGPELPGADHLFALDAPTDDSCPGCGEADPTFVCCPAHPMASTTLHTYLTAGLDLTAAPTDQLSALYEHTCAVSALLYSAGDTEGERTAEYHADRIAVVLTARGVL